MDSLLRKTSPLARRSSQFAFIVTLSSTLGFGQYMGLGGGTARNIALGGGPANSYLVDLLRIHVNPSLQAKFSNLFWGDVGFLATDVAQGGGRGQYLGASVEVSENMYLGVILNRRESPLYNVDPSNPPRDPIQEMNTLVVSVLGFGAQPFSRPLSPVEIVTSYRGDGYELGAAMTLGSWSGKRSGNGEAQQKDNTVRFKLGTVAPLSSGVIVDVAGLMGFNSISGTSVSSSGAQSELSMDGGSELGLDARLLCDLNEKWKFVPLGRWYSFSWGIKQVRNGALVIPNPASEYSHSEIEIGVGVNYSTEKTLLLGGMSYQQIILVSDYRTSKTSVKTTDLPKVNAGVEVFIASWMVGRIGYFDRLASTETTVESSSSTTTTITSTELPWYGDLNSLSAAQQRVTIGVGLKFDGLALDATIGEGYFLNGPWPLSGSSQALFGVLSLSYRF
jgi:hypothetical protein